MKTKGTYGRRSIYACGGCGEVGLPCRAKKKGGCGGEGMAREGRWSDEKCYLCQGKLQEWEGTGAAGGEHSDRVDAAGETTESSPDESETSSEEDEAEDSNSKRLGEDTTKWKRFKSVNQAMQAFNAPTRSRSNTTDEARQAIASASSRAAQDLRSGTDAAAEAAKKGLSSVLKGVTGAKERNEPQVLHMEDGTIYRREGSRAKERVKKDALGERTNGQALSLEQMGLRAPTTASAEETQQVAELLSGLTDTILRTRAQDAGILRYDVLVRPS